jgi:hypothetical protein
MAHQKPDVTSINKLENLILTCFRGLFCPTNMAGIYGSEELFSASARLSALPF